MSLVLANSIHFMSQLLSYIASLVLDEQKCSENVQHVRHFGLKMDQVLKYIVEQQRLASLRIRQRLCLYTRM